MKKVIFANTSKNPQTVEQKFKFATRTFAAATPDSTTVDERRIYSIFEILESYFYVTKKSVTNIYIIYIRKNILLKDIKIFASIK